jgi:hypothetical protein
MRQRSIKEPSCLKQRVWVVFSKALKQMGIAGINKNLEKKRI